MFDGDLPLILGEGLLSDEFPETGSCKQLPYYFVIAASLQVADEVGCRSGLEPAEPRPRSSHIEGVRNEVLAAAGRPSPMPECQSVSGAH